MIYPQEKGSAIRCRDLANYTEHVCPSDASPDQFALLNFEEPVVKNVKLVDKQIATDGGKEYLVTVKHENDIDKLRTLVATNANKYDFNFVVSGRWAKQPHINPSIRELADLAYVGIGVTLFVAVASFIVATIGGLMERRRSLYTLRLGGMRLIQLKRTADYFSSIVRYWCLDGRGIYENVLDDAEASADANVLCHRWSWATDGHHRYLLDFADGRQADAGGG